MQKMEFSSFRDPSGVVFEENGGIYRQINKIYMPQYRKLMDCGLAQNLQKNGMLIRHWETDAPCISDEGALVIQAEKIPYVSYIYEWSFGQIKDAALLTLKMHRKALDAGMILKDASAYNIQFLHGSPVMIDTLSFDFYTAGEPWVAYGQFCRHFLAPLLLMCYTDLRLNRLMELFIDGIPLDLASTLLHGKGGLFAKQHICWHAKSISKHSMDGRAGEQRAAKAASLPLNLHIALIEGMIRGIEALELKNVQTEWGDYYQHTNYSESASDSKLKLVFDMLTAIRPSTVWDLGANDGRYSKVALEVGASVVAFDIDPIAVERNYADVRRNKTEMLPLVLDLTNPSPGIGFANQERKTIDQRQHPDCILMLAVIHHLAISNNLAFRQIAKWLSQITRDLIIEFVPKEDSQVQILLATRVDIFPNYTQKDFTEAFGEYFELRSEERVGDSKRTLYHFHVR